MFTADEIAKGFEAAGDRMGGIEEGQKLLEDNLAALQKTLKAYGKAFVSGQHEGEKYNGFWPNEEMAKSFGLLVWKAIGKDTKHIEDPYGTKTMGTGVNTEGGNLVPVELSSVIIQKMGIYGKFRKYATKVKLGTAYQNVPRITTDLTVYCPEEGDAITASDLVTGLVKLQVRKFACLCVINSELEEDSLIGMAEIVGQSIARSIAQKEDLIGFLGDGTSAYFGMTGIVGALRGVSDTISEIQSLVVASGNAYSEITLGDFRKVVARLPEEADEDARWYMSKKFYYEVVYPLAEAAGVASLFEILSDKKGRYFLGYPVEFVSCMPSTEANSQICAILGDLALGAYLGERRVLSIDRSSEVLFGNDQVAIRGTERIDINAFGVGDTDETGPIVALITAAS